MDNLLTSEEARWGLVATGSAVVAGVVVRQLLERGWRGWSGGDPPRNPADPSVSWRQALAWAGATGAAVAVARVVARRSAASGWRKVTGDDPPA